MASIGLFVTLSFGWGRSTTWFKDLMRPFGKERCRSELILLAYLDDFLIQKSPCGVVSTLENCDIVRKVIRALMRSFGVTIHPLKREWDGYIPSRTLGWIYKRKKCVYMLPQEKWKRCGKCRKIFSTKLCGDIGGYRGIILHLFVVYEFL